MYNKINYHIDLLLQQINFEKHIAPYVKMNDELYINGIDSEDFKNTFKKFYQLNAARLSISFIDNFFKILKCYLHNNKINVEHIVNELYEIPSNLNDRNTVQFSFASKIVHTINNSKPIYDSKIAHFFFLPTIKPNWKKEKK